MTFPKLNLSYAEMFSHVCLLLVVLNLKQFHDCLRVGHCKSQQNLTTVSVNLPRFGASPETGMDCVDVIDSCDWLTRVTRGSVKGRKS